MSIDRAFYEKAFDPTAHVNKMTALGDVPTQMNKLTFDISHMHKSLADAVHTNHELLLGRAQKLAQLENRTNMAKSGIQDLKDGLGSLQALVTQPYVDLERNIAVLTRLQSACRLLRHLESLLDAVGQLELAGDDITQRAVTLSQLGSLLKADDSLKHINVVANCWRLHDEARQKLLKLTLSQLEAELSASDKTNQDAIRIVLRVWSQLQYTEDGLKAWVETHLERTGELFKSTFDIFTLAKDIPKKDGAVSLTALSTLFWDTFGQMIQHLGSVTRQVFALETVALGTTVQHGSMMAYVCDEWSWEEGLWAHFWKSLCRSLDRTLKVTAKPNSPLHQVLQTDGFPRLVSAFEEMLTKFSIDMSYPDVMEDESFERQELYKSLGMLEQVFLNKSLNRVFDPINAAFSKGRKAPSRSDVSLISKAMSSELELVRVAPYLTRQVLKSLGKGVSLYGVKAESLVATDPTAYTMWEVSTASASSSRPSGVALNFDVANGLGMLVEAVEVCLRDIIGGSEVLRDLVQNDMKNARKVLAVVFDPLFRNIAKRVDTVILQVHKDVYTSKQAQLDDRDGIKVTRVLQELGKVFAFVEREIVQVLSCKVELRPYIKYLSDRTIRLFLRHTSLLKTIDEGGRLKLANDLAQLEFALGSLWNSVGMDASRNTEIGCSNLTLRAYRSAIFCDAVQLGTTESVHKKLGLQTLVHLLFSCGPDAFQYPHQRFGLNPKSYSEWIDERASTGPEMREGMSEKGLEEWINMVREALKMYTKEVDKKGEKVYCDSFVQIQRFLQQ